MARTSSISARRARSPSPPGGRGDDSAVAKSVGVARRDRGAHLAIVHPSWLQSAGITCGTAWLPVDRRNSPVVSVAGGERRSRGAAGAGGKWVALRSADRGGAGDRGNPAHGWPPGHALPDQPAAGLGHHTPGRPHSQPARGAERLVRSLVQGAFPLQRRGGVAHAGRRSSVNGAGAPVVPRLAGGGLRRRRRSAVAGGKGATRTAAATAVDQRAVDRVGDSVEGASTAARARNVSQESSSRKSTSNATPQRCSCRLKLVVVLTASQGCPGRGVSGRPVRPRRR